MNQSFAERQRAIEAKKAMTLIERARSVNSNASAATSDSLPRETSSAVDSNMEPAEISGEFAPGPTSDRKRSADEMMIGLGGAMAGGGDSSVGVRHDGGGVPFPNDDASEGIQSRVSRPRKRAAAESRVMSTMADVS